MPLSRLVIRRPVAGEYAPPFGKYIDLIDEVDLTALLGRQLEQLTGLLSPLDDAEALTYHAPYTWSIKQVVGHVTDCERVFGMRALWIARGDATPLPSFGEDTFMAHSDFDHWPLAALLEELTLLRRSHIALISRFTSDDWARTGTVSDHPMTTRAMVYALAGHTEHHLRIARARLGG